MLKNTFFVYLTFFNRCCCCTSCYIWLLSQKDNTFLLYLTIMHFLLSMLNRYTIIINFSTFIVSLLNTHFHIVVSLPFLWTYDPIEAKVYHANYFSDYSLDVNFICILDRLWTDNLWWFSNDQGLIPDLPEDYRTQVVSFFVIHNLLYERLISWRG